MDARFKVDGTFSLDDMETFVIHGVVESGAVREGMRAKPIDAPIASVEFLRAASRREATALLFDCADAGQRAKWAKAVTRGQVIDLLG